MHVILEQCKIDRFLDALSYRGTRRKQHPFCFHLKDKMGFFTPRNNIVSGLYAVYIAYEVLYYI